MKKILIIEDDYQFRSLLMGRINQLFANDQLDFYFAANEEEAKQGISEKDYHLITLDGQLDYGHGRNVLKLMSEKQQSVTIVISNDEHFLIEAQKMGLRTSSKDNIFETLIL